MSKRIISILTTVVMVVSLVGVLPAMTAGAEDYEYYLTQLQNKTSSKIIEFLYDDYDNDSEYEAFAVTCTNLPKDCYEGVICDIWFINSIGITKIKSNFMAELNEDYTVANILNSNGTKIITYNEWYQTGNLAYIYYVKGSKLIYDSNSSGKICFLKEDKDKNWLSGCHSTYDASVDGSGHTWKEYYFYFDNGLKEYGGISITESQLLELDGSFDIVNKIKSKGVIKGIYSRENGIININYSVDETSNSNATLLYTNDKVNLIKYNDWKDDELGYSDQGGIYSSAMIPEIATYPDGITQYKNHNSSGQESENDYAIKLYSAMPALTVGVGQEINCAVQFEKDGMVINGNDGIDFQFIVDDSSILDISNIKKDSDKEKEGENGTWFTINGKKEGIVKLTITEINTGTVYYTNIQVSDGILSFSANCMPQYYEYNFEYNGFISGMYIDEFNFNESESTVSFNVYNSVSRLGVVDVYDANGNLVDCVPIERFDGNYVSSIKDTVVNGYKLLKDGFNKELMTYKQDSYSQKTPILNLKVPKGGRIEITNNINYSDTCAIANACALTVESLLTFSGSLSGTKEVKKVSNETVGKIIKNNLKENVSKLGKKFIKTFAEKTYEEVGLSTLTYSMTDCINSFADVFENMNIDLFDLIIESSKSVGISVAEDSLKAAMGSAGVVLDGLFLLSDYADLTSFYTTCGSNNPYNSLYIYIPIDNSSLCDNGVSIKPEDNSDYLLNGNYVLRSLVVTKDTILPDSVWRNLNDISSDYIVREIRLEKDGKETQPQKTVQVSVEIPEEYSQAKYCYVYWVKEDGTLETLKRPAIRQGKFLVFYVDHFSYYAIVALNNAINISPIPPTKSPSTKSPKIATKTNTKSPAIKKAKVKNLKVKTKSKKITVSWKKIKIAKGYQIQAATNKKFKKKQIVFDKKTKKKKITIKGNKIKKNRIYYIRVRAYTTSKNADGKPKYTYSKWTKKNVKTN